MSAPVLLVKLVVLRGWRTLSICSFKMVLLGLSMKWSVGEDWGWGQVNIIRIFSIELEKLLQQLIQNWIISKLQHGSVWDKSRDGLHHRVSPWQVSNKFRFTSAILGNWLEVQLHIPGCVPVEAQRHLLDLRQLLLHAQHQYVCLHGNGQSLLRPVENYILCRTQCCNNGLVCNLWKKKNVMFRPIVITKPAKIIYSGFLIRTQLLNFVFPAARIVALLGLSVVMGIA